MSFNKISKLVVGAFLLMANTSLYAEESLTTPYEGVHFGMDLSGIMSGDDKGYQINASGTRTGYTSKQSFTGDLSLGIVAGYNRLIANNVILGFEAGYHKFNDADHSSVWLNSGVADSTYPLETTLKNRIDLKGKLGYLINDSRCLVFLTGGYSRIEIERTNLSENADPALRQAYDTQQSYNGWTIGVGREYLFTNNISVKIEYLFTDYRENTVNTSFINTSGTKHVNSMNSQVLRLGVSYWLD